MCFKTCICVHSLCTYIVVLLRSKTLYYCMTIVIMCVFVCVCGYSEQEENSDSYWKQQYEELR